MLEVKPLVSVARTATIEVAETTMKRSPAPLQKHLLGGCTVDMVLSCSVKVCHVCA